MRILVLNCGGSSVKYQLVEMPQERVMARGSVERIGKEDGQLQLDIFAAERGCGSGTDSSKMSRVLPVPDHGAAIGLALEALTDPENGIIHSFSEIDAVGHRVVHGGEKCTGSLMATDEVVAVLREFFDLAPLHNPPNVEGIEVCQRLMPETPMVAVFDSSLHQSLPPHAYTYAIPYHYYEKYRVRRYGFHGITFRYMTQRAAEFLQRPLEELKIVNLMLGSGTTACAFKEGMSIDVSTGLTPTEGLVQSTRCGDIDPLVVTYLMRKEGIDPDRMDEILNKESGWLGISGVSNDLRELFEAAAAGSARAQLAIDTFVYRTKKYVGAYAAAMGGIDVLVFSGGVGERSTLIRERICEGMEFLGIYLDKAANESPDLEKRISRADAPVEVLVIPTDEEIVIARDTYRIVREQQAGEHGDG